MPVFPGKERLGNRITVKTEMDGNLDGHTYTQASEHGNSIYHTRDDELSRLAQTLSNKVISNYLHSAFVCRLFSCSQASEPTNNHGRSTQQLSPETSAIHDKMFAKIFS